MFINHHSKRLLSITISPSDIIKIVSVYVGIMDDQDFSDVPKFHMTDDILHRKELVESICNLIEKRKISDSLTIGICGPWGTGKTTFINFIKEQLSIDEKKDAGSETLNKIQVVDFNPWLYSSHEDLAVQFFDLLSYQFSSKVKRAMIRFRKRIPNLESISHIFPDNEISRMLGSFSKLLSDNSEGVPVEDLKRNISKKMKESEKKLVVIIDDIDRLDEDEIRMVMKLVRSVADFQNTIYILCYDQIIVEKALSTNMYDGQRYLQKIVNIQIHLPEYRNEDVLKIMIDQYKKTIGERALNEAESKMFANISEVEMTVREVKMIVSRFQTLYDVSKDNTCPADFLALTLVDVLDSGAYRWITENRYRLCGMGMPTLDELMNGERPDYITEYNDLKLREDLIEVIGEMFPCFKKGRFLNKKEEYVEYRIREPRFVDNYFLLTPSSLRFSDKMVQDFLKLDEVDVIYSRLTDERFSDLNELISRACDKVRFHREMIPFLKHLSDTILNQPFGNGKWLPIDRAWGLESIVEEYVLTQGDIHDSVGYIESQRPLDGIHRIIFFGTVAMKLFRGIPEQENNESIVGLYSAISETMLSSLPDHKSEISDLELYMMIILLKRIDEETAKRVFLELKSDYKQRQELYRVLNDYRLDPKPLSDLAEDGGEPILLSEVQ